MKRLAASIVLMTLVTASSCGRRETAGGTGVITNAPGAHITLSTSTSKPGRAGRFAQALDVNLDAALKYIDDFSAAMGLQYARLSYDTNRYLLQYAEIIPRLSDEEFMDLVRISSWRVAGRRTLRKLLTCGSAWERA